MNMKDKAIELLKERPKLLALNIVEAHANDKVDYGGEWTDDLFYKGIKFGAKYGTDVEVISFVNDKLKHDESKPLLYDLEDVVDYVFTNDSLNKMVELLEGEAYAKLGKE